MGGKGLAWAIAALSCAVVVAGVVLFWVEQPSLGMSVGVPAGATLAASIVTWAAAAPPRVGQSTLEQLERARLTLADRVMEGLRGSGRSYEALPPLSRTLPVCWAASAPGRIDDAVRSGSDDAATMAARVRSRQQPRLIILGSTDSGKTTLARLLMAELLGHLKPADPVPVFLPLTTWNPHQYSLQEWIVREISEIAPELRHTASYGSSAVAALINHGKVLPILDGLDTIPQTYLRSLLTSDDLLRQPQLVLTCRTAEFRDASDGQALPDALVFTPGLVPVGEAEQFLQNFANDPDSWDAVFREISNDPQGHLARALSIPRLIYLASVAYGDANPKELIVSSPYSSVHDVENRILRALPEAQLPTQGTWAASSPWYGDKAVEWLRYLARTACDPHTGELAWWSIFRAVPILNKHPAAVRALTSSFITLILVSFFNRYRGSFTTYGWLTGTAYALAIAAACLLLYPPHRNQSNYDFRRPAFSWWIRHKLARSWRVITASVTGGSLFGLIIAVRVHILHGGNPDSTGVVKGIAAGMVIGLSAVIAGIPFPSGRERSTTHERPSGRPLIDPGLRRFSGWASITIASSLGVSFGVITGVLAVVQHQGDHGAPHLATGLEYGLIMGLNFGVGAWLVGLARTRTVSLTLPDPYAIFRAERRFSLLAIVILGGTFASAFSLNSSLGWSHDSTIPDGVVGAIVGSLASEWPLYIIAVTIAAARRKIPLRLMKFLELCRSQGVLQPTGMCYRFRESTPWIQLDGMQRRAEQPDLRSVASAPAGADALMTHS